MENIAVNATPSQNVEKYFVKLFFGASIVVFPLFVVMFSIFMEVVSIN